MVKNEKIDFVITWVDGSDPVWQEDKAKYSPIGADTRKARFRDWNQLQYWFRAVEKFAPWVNKIHFVTYGHIPPWLNVDHPKLHIVNHKEFIPEEYLPVFNSTAIEVHLHRIPGLSSQFVYFCDDFYLMRPCKPTDFFKNGLPADMVKFIPIPPHGNEMYYYHLYNDYSIYRSYVTGRDIPRSLFKFINWNYGFSAFSNFFSILSKNLYLQSHHFPMPLLKASMEKVWGDHPTALEKTAMSRFRQITNNSLESFRGYQLVTGNFYPINKSGIVLNTKDVTRTKAVIENCKYKFMCLSDNSNDCDFESDKQQINNSFDKVFPERCSFEREN